MNQEILHTTLTSQNWQSASRTLLAKMFSEFLYEEIIKPSVIEKQGNIATYELTLPESIAYRFQAKHRFFDSYHVFPETIQRREGTAWESATNPMQFVLDIHTTVGMTAETTAHLIKELHNTPSRRYSHSSPSARKANRSHHP